MSLICTKCQDRGLIIKEGIAHPCSCVRERAKKNIFQSSGLPPALTNHRFQFFNFAYYPKEKNDFTKSISYFESAQITYHAAKTFVRKYLEDSSTVSGLLFSGQVGSGKTFLSCCIANALLDKGCAVLFIVVPDMLDRLRATYGAHQALGYSEQDLLDEARTAPVLILDDLGAHNYTDWTRNKLYSIINYRLNYCLPTIITTNISLEDLEQFLGDRTTSRILQMCTPYRLMVDVDIRMLQKRRERRMAGEL